MGLLRMRRLRSEPRRYTRLLRWGAAASIVASASLMGASPASAAFTDCSHGAYGAGGNYCVWYYQNYSNLTYFQASSNYITGNVNYGALMRSWGNRISNRTVDYYDEYWNFVVTMAHDTGNTSSNQYHVYYGSVY
jgi:hypothetical protein